MDYYYGTNMAQKNRHLKNLLPDCSTQRETYEAEVWLKIYYVDFFKYDCWKDNLSSLDSLIGMENELQPLLKTNFTLFLCGVEGPESKVLINWKSTITGNWA